MQQSFEVFVVAERLTAVDNDVTTGIIHLSQMELDILVIGFPSKH